MIACRPTQRNLLDFFWGTHLECAFHVSGFSRPKYLILLENDSPLAFGSNDTAVSWPKVAPQVAGRFLRCRNLAIESRRLGLHTSSRRFSIDDVHYALRKSRERLSCCFDILEWQTSWHPQFGALPRIVSAMLPSCQRSGSSGRETPTGFRAAGTPRLRPGASAGSWPHTTRTQTRQRERGGTACAFS